MRKHAELIKQWAEDETLEIECLQTSGEWYPVPNPYWNISVEYRIKPKAKNNFEMWQWALMDDGKTFAGLHYFATKKEAEEYYHCRVVCRIEGSRIEVEE